MNQSKKNIQKKKTAARHTGISDWIYEEKFHYLLLLAGTFLLYGWTLTFQYNLDDDYIISLLSEIDNTAAGAVSIFQMWFASSDYRPVTVLSFWIERLIFGELNPGTSHFINVLLYGLLLAGMYRFIITARFYPDKNHVKLFAMLATLFFLVHPNHVSVVANIKSRDNLLSLFFGILAARQLLLALDRRKVIHYLLFLLFILPAMLSKRDAYALVILPGLVILFFREWDYKNFIRTVIIIFLLYLFITTVFGILRSFTDSRLLQNFMRMSENPLLAEHSLADCLSMCLTTLFYYIKFLFIPWGYYFYFGYNQVPLTPLFSLLNLLTICLLILLFYLSIRSFRQNRIYLFSLLFFGLAIGYALNLFNPIAGIIMDRYNFIPSLGFCLALAALATDRHIRKPGSVKLVFPVTALLLVFAGFTFYRTSAWKNYFTLFDRDLKHLEQSANAYRLAGGTYIHLALMEELKENYDRNLTDSFINKGERYVLQSLKIYDSSPQAWELAGLCEYYRKNDSTALLKFRKSFQSDTNYLSGANYIGAAYWNLNQLDSAQYYFSYVMNREPFFNYSANNLINLLIQNKRAKEADSILRVLNQRFPDDKRLKNKMIEFYGPGLP